VDKVVEAGMTEDRGKCTRLFARIVKKNVKSHLSQEKTVRFIAKTVFQSTKMAAVNIQTVLQEVKSPSGKLLAGFLLSFFIATMPALAQDSLSSNDIITKMKTQLDLQDDQVTNITPVIEKYTMAFEDLQKSIDDGTINPSAIDSQRQGIEAEETQELSQYLKPNQLSEWNSMQGQLYQQKDTGDTNADSDTYSNLPRDTSQQNQ
jgi:hypothetical protein